MPGFAVVLRKEHFHAQAAFREQRSAMRSFFRRVIMLFVVRMGLFPFVRRVGLVALMIAMPLLTHYALAKRKPLLEAPDEMRLRTWVQLARTFYRVQRRIVVALAARDVTLPQFDVLATLRFGEGLTQQELAKRLLVTKGNVCGVLDRLEALGWVERRPDPDDRRANRVHLTTVGRRKVETLLPEHDALVLKTLRTLPDAGVKSLRKLLEAVEVAVDGP